jgi:glycosyltransferase involved in cell wall biosynthesis
MRVAVVPAKNEAAGLASLIGELRRRVDVVLVIDDGSEDATGHVAESLGCVVLRNDRCLGYGATLRRGLLWCCNAHASAVVTIDADGQHEAAWIDSGITKLDQGADVVFGNRFATSVGVPQTKLLSNNFAWDCVKQCIGRKPICEDVSCGFRIYGPRGLLASVETRVESTSGYSFAQATCVQLHNKDLSLAAINVPAIYFEPVYGTHISEMRDFLLWLVACTPLKKDAERWFDCILRGRALSLEFEDWRIGTTIIVIGHRFREFVRFSVETNATVL